ncbi:MAG: YihY/virulence factor BrkB family protein [Actinobacteria bacterium]|nr:YihY/virulence factor BrkB family protein [Actinomycetota bacterium]
MQAFPIRVWRRFLQRNGFLLAASLSYQSLFAVFAVLYTAFAIVGLWLGGSELAITRMIDIINGAVPNLISEHGLATPEAVATIATNSSGVLVATGAVALVVALWTAIGFVTFARRAVRDIFGLPFDGRNYLLLKARDLVAALLFGLAQALASALGVLGTGALRGILKLLGVDGLPALANFLSQALSLLVSFGINATAIALLVHFLTGTHLPWRTIWPGALLGGAALAVLQVGAGLLFLYSPTNPLLATFSVVIGFLLWFRLIAIVILVASAWIAVSASDRDQPLVPEDEHARRRAEREAICVAARVQVRGATAALHAAPWYRRRRAARELRRAEAALAHAESLLAEADAERVAATESTVVGRLRTLAAGSPDPNVRGPR